MKRLLDNEKKKLGIIIHYYRNQLFKSNIDNKDEYKQVNFCKKICSQAQLSRLEHGEVLKEQSLYEQLLDKLNLKCEKIPLKDTLTFEKAMHDILVFQNDDDLIINYNQYILLVNRFQNIFKHNIIYTHYNYVLEFILSILNNDYDEAKFLIDDVEGTLEILPPRFLILALHYLGIYYTNRSKFQEANKRFLLCIEHMIQNGIENDLIFVDITYNYIKQNKIIHALEYLYKAKTCFDDTHNNLILERIYRYYSIIYLKERYYDECRENLLKANEFIKDTEQLEIKSNLLYVQALLDYSVGEYINSQALLKKAYNLDQSEHLLLFKMIIDHKLNTLEQYNFYEEINQSLYKLYSMDENKEDYFDDIIKDHLTLIPYEVSLIIITDMYNYLKSNKKYKKALELFDNYLA